MENRIINHYLCSINQSKPGAHRYKQTRQTPQQAAAGYITGQFNEVNYSAELLQPGTVKRLLVMHDQCILALWENGAFKIKPYPNWKHTVNQIFNQLRTGAKA